MLTSEHGVTPPRTTGADPSAPPDHPPRPARRLRFLAALLGFLGAALALAFPFLPVVQDTATITWPSPTTGTRSVDAPLVAYRPESMSVEIPCSAVTSLDARTDGRVTLFSTTPPLSPSGPQVGMQLTVDDGQLTLANRGQQVAASPVPSGPCLVRVSSDTAVTTVDLGNSQEIAIALDVRPQVVGIYSDLDAARDDITGVTVDVVTDTRFQTSPTTLKTIAGALAVLFFVGSLVALHVLDGRVGRRAPRLTPRRWWMPTTRDAVVVTALLVWAVIGSQTSDDGYIMGIARARESAGYIGNYYRWFNVPEAPFGWFYEIYAWWVQIDDAVLWMRLPSVLMGIVSWLLISREMLGRLGQQVRRSTAAAWAAAGVFLMFWLPYNNGLRPEPVCVISALLAFCAVERAVATRRLAPVALGLAAAAFALAATPTGLLAIAPFLASARPLFKLFAERVRAAGPLSAFLPVLASGLVVLVVVFADQTYAAVAEASRIRFIIGPNYSWYQELIRYQQLFSFSADGSLARRTPVLLLFLGLIVCLVVLLRRDRIRGAALGPSQRLIGSTLLGFLVLVLTPTKWTHHFGAFAALGAGMAALTALATSSDVLRSWRNRALFLSAVFATLALAFTGPNTWWYTNNWGMPWFNRPPDLDGYYFSDIFMTISAVLLLLAAVEHIRGIPEERRPRDPADHSALRRRVEPLVERPRAAAGRLRRSSGATRVQRRARALRISSYPIAVICGLVVLFELGTAAQAMENQEGSFSLGNDVLANPFGGSCGLADDVRIEGSPTAGLLPVAPPVAGTVPSAPGVLPTIVQPGQTPADAAAAPDPSSPAAGGSTSTTATSSATPSSSSAASTDTSPTTSTTPSTPPPPPAPLPANTFASSSPQAQLVDPRPGNVGFTPAGAQPPVGGGTGVSGYEYSLRNDLAGDTLGTFDEAGTGTGVLRTDWYSVSDELRSGDTPLVLTAAGRLNGGNFLTLQYAQRLPDGRIRILGQDQIDDGALGEAPWREIRVNLASTTGARADEVRLIAQDRSLGPAGWLAVAPMRAPQLVPMTSVAGNGTPMYLEWPVQFASPCLRPFDVRDGIAEVPRFRLIADASQFRPGGEGWSQAGAGGPLGWIDVLARQTEVPAYLQGQTGLDWGRLQSLEPYAPDTAAPTVVRGDKTVSGTSQQGELGLPPPGVPSPER